MLVSLHRLTAVGNGASGDPAQTCGPRDRADWRPVRVNGKKRGRATGYPTRPAIPCRFQSS